MLGTICFFLPGSSISAADITLKPGGLAAVLEQARRAPKPVRIVSNMTPFAGLPDGFERRLALDAPKPSGSLANSSCLSARSSPPPRSPRRDDLA